METTRDAIQQELDDIHQAKDSSATQLEQWHQEELKVLAEVRGNPFPQSTSFISLNTGLTMAQTFRALSELAADGLVLKGQKGDRYVWAGASQEQLEETSF
jgi:hypothetical protein